MEKYFQSIFLCRKLVIKVAKPRKLFLSFRPRLHKMTEKNRRTNFTFVFENGTAMKNPLRF